MPDHWFEKNPVMSNNSKFMSLQKNLVFLGMSLFYYYYYFLMFGFNPMMDIVPIRT